MGWAGGMRVWLLFLIGSLRFILEVQSSEPRKNTWKQNENLKILVLHKGDIL